MTPMLESIVVPAVIQAGIGTLIWFSVQRAVERRDRQLDALQSEVTNLKDERVAALDVRIENGEKARKEIYEHIAKIRQTFVHKQECEKAMTLLREQYAEFQAAVLKLERVSEQTSNVAAQTKTLFEEIMKAQRELAALAAHVEDLQPGRD